MESEQRTLTLIAAAVEEEEEEDDESDDEAFDKDDADSCNLASFFLCRGPAMCLRDW